MTTILDVSGPDGNAFSVLGMTQQILRELGKSPNEIDEVMNDAMGGDYNRLLRVCIMACEDYFEDQRSDNY